MITGSCDQPTFARFASSTLKTIDKNKIYCKKINTHIPGAGEDAGRLATAAAALSAGFGSCNHLTCVAGPYLAPNSLYKAHHHSHSLTPCHF